VETTYIAKWCWKGDVPQILLDELSLCDQIHSDLHKQSSPHQRVSRFENGFQAIVFGSVRSACLSLLGNDLPTGVLKMRLTIADTLTVW